MDPHEERLRDEVIYLHSLWHKGPPRTNPNPNFRPHFTLHQPLNPPSFKPTFINNGSTVVSTPPSINTTNTVMKTKKRKPKKKIIVESGSKTEVELGGRSESCDVQWQSKVTPIEERLDSGSGWPEMKAKAVVPTRGLTGEERTKLVPNQMQCKGLDASRDFFATKECGSGSDEDDDDDEDMDDGDDDDGGDGDCEKCDEYEFLLSLFTDDDDLRSYYEKNYENGEFYCLICGGIGKKVWKKYKDVVAVVQHAIALSKTAKRRAHRAFAQVICKVLGWDFTRLPTIVLSGNEKLSQSLAKLNGSKVDANAIVDTGDKTAIKGEDSSKCKEVILDLCSTRSVDVGTSELVVCKDDSKGHKVNANSKMGGSKKVDTSELEISVGELMNCSEMLKEFEAETIQCEQSKITVEIIDLDGPDEDGANPKT